MSAQAGALSAGIVRTRVIVRAVDRAPDADAVRTAVILGARVLVVARSSVRGVDASGARIWFVVGARVFVIAIGGRLRHAGSRSTDGPAAGICAGPSFVGVSGGAGPRGRVAHTLLALRIERGAVFLCPGTGTGGAGVIDRAGVFIIAGIRVGRIRARPADTNVLGANIPVVAAGNRIRWMCACPAGTNVIGAEVSIVVAGIRIRWMRAHFVAAQVVRAWVSIVVARTSNRCVFADPAETRPTVAGQFRADDGCPGAPPKRTRIVLRAWIAVVTRSAVENGDAVARIALMVGARIIVRRRT